ncbi:Crp/Fnr family transcriptional regulator [Reinekea sp. G2M2-21]|uniref:Crp/Fnr family transcriptional regulator n=1 Tax=Reinekea sp. G2M2-21 TaxID=2788942 RepID=UPI0018AA6A84|nr:cyclic nucleotide-binding domain-containing protein [Reinekea sp. G2M2-21]
MLLLGERPSYVDQLTDRLKKLSHKLFEALPPGQPVTLSATQDLYALESSENLFIVRHGNLTANSENRVCLYFEAGDLIGLTQCYQLPSLRVSIEDNAEVEQYEADTLLRYVNETKERQAIWTSYLVTQMTLFQDAFGRNQLNVSQPHTGFLNFAEGQTIITQGDDAKEVFTILTGSADVFVDDICVGKVEQDEIFGAMAVFTGEKRSATVKATSNCTVLAVPKEEFITLIQSHPQTTMTLIENMARKITAMNTQFTQQETP